MKLEGLRWSSGGVTMYIPHGRRDILHHLFARRLWRSIVSAKFQGALPNVFLACSRGKSIGKNSGRVDPQARPNRCSFTIANSRRTSIPRNRVPNRL